MLAFSQVPARPRTDMKTGAAYFVAGILFCLSAACHADDEATFSSLIPPWTRIANSERAESDAFPGHGCIEAGAFLLPAPFGDAGMHEFVHADGTPTTCAFHTWYPSASGVSLSDADEAPRASGTVQTKTVALREDALSAPVNRRASHVNKTVSSTHYPWLLFVCVLVLALALLTLLGALGRLLYLRWFSERAILARAVKRGLRRNEFHLEYQPVFYTSTRKCVGLEVALRWKNVAYGLRGEAWYMDKVVDRHSARKIVAFVLSTAERELGHLADGRKLYVMVNLWKTWLENEECMSLIAATVKSFTSCRLVFQVKAEDLPQQLGSIVRLREDKVRIAVSRVKAGTSITASALPVAFEFIKVDRDVMGLDAADRLRTLQAIAAAGRQLDVAVIADGVEGSGQYHAVGRARIDLAQGFFLGKTIPAGQLPALFEKLDWWQGQHVSTASAASPA